MSLRSLVLRKSSKGLLPVVSACCALFLAGCGGPMADIFNGTKFSERSMGVSASPRVTSSRNVPKGGGRHQIGQPYTVAGQTFVPREQPDLDVVGQASWYGPAFHGRLTANGEVFDQYHLSGAHPTLPLPSYVRVTNVANGQSALVRINDRGPFSNSRVIDLSRRTAEVLGFKQQGIADVRVQYVGPAPLNGDDTRFLVGAINQLTPYERDMGTRMAYQDVQVAQTPVPTAVDAVAGAVDGPPSDVPFQILSYGQGASLDIADDIESEPSGTAVRLDLGSFSDAQHAKMIAQEFAVLGAVDQVEYTYEHGSSITLTLSHLREGVTASDVRLLADQLGLTASF